MKLYTHYFSPYARKVEILARVLNIDINPQRPVHDKAQGYIHKHNPLGKIPALEWQPQQYLFDSAVICQYLCHISDQNFLPHDNTPNGEGDSAHRRFILLWQHALGDGLSDAVYNYRYEIARPQTHHWPEMIDRHKCAIENSVKTLESLSQLLGGPWSYGNIAIICALDYMRFRADFIDLETHAPKLFEWHQNFIQDPHYIATYGYAD